MVFTEMGIFLPLVLSRVINGDVTLPPRDELFLPSMVNKVPRFLVNSKKDEMQQWVRQVGVKN